VPQASRKAQEVLHGFEYLQCVSEADGKRQQVRLLAWLVCCKGCVLGVGLKGSVGL
jgi:hypothetical protein